MTTPADGSVVAPKSEPILDHYDVRYKRADDYLTTTISGRGLEVHGQWKDTDMGVLIHREVQGPGEEHPPDTGSGIATVQAPQGCLLKVSLMSNNPKLERMDESFTVYSDGSYRAQGKGLRVLGPSISSSPGKGRGYVGCCPSRWKPY